MDAIYSIIRMLEAAEGPDRKIEGDIYRYISAPEWKPDVVESIKAEYCYTHASRWTSSLEVALSLVPADHFVSAQCLWPRMNNNKISVVRAADDVITGENNHLTTAALAVCIAALKARAAIAAARTEAT